MLKQKRTSLWPSSLKAAPGFDLKGFMQTQARELERLVNGAFVVVIEKRIVESVFIYNFTIELPRLGYRYQLFSIRMIGDHFPAVIDAPHLSEPHRIERVSDEAALEQSLRRLFHDPDTTRIIVSLAGEGGPLGMTDAALPV